MHVQPPAGHVKCANTEHIACHFMGQHATSTITFLGLPQGSVSGPPAYLAGNH